MLFDLKKLREEHTQVLNDWEESIKLQGELDGKTDQTDEDKKKVETLKATGEELKGKADSIESKMKIAEDMAKRRATNETAGKLAEPAQPGAPFDAEGKNHGVPAQPNDHQKEERIKEGYFWGYVRNGSQVEIPDKALDEMRPSGKTFQEGASGIKLPRHLAQMVQGPAAYNAKMLGKYDELAGKAVGDDPFLTTDANFPEVMAPPEFMTELLELPPEPPFLFDRVRKVPTKTGTIRWPKVTQTDGSEYGGVVVDWIGEAGEKPKTEPIFEQVSIQTHELAARTEISRTLLSRSVIDMTQFIGREFRGAIMNEKDNVFLTGSGVGRPLGIMNTSGVRTVARQLAGDVSYDDLVNMEHAIRVNHRAGSVWVMADDVIKILRKKKDTDGRPLFVENSRTGAFDMLFGKPVIATHRLTEEFDDVVFGDWRQYIAPIETDVVILRSDHRKIENNIVVFVVFIMCGGKPVQERAFVRLAAVGS